MICANKIASPVSPDVHEAMHKLDAVTSDLLQMSDLLRERSSPVLRTKQPSQRGESGKKDYSTPLAAQIDRQADNVEQALEIIRDIIDRIQV